MIGPPVFSKLQPLVFNREGSSVLQESNIEMENPPVLDGWSYEIRVKIIAMMVYRRLLLWYSTSRILIMTETLPWGPPNTCIPCGHMNVYSRCISQWISEVFPAND